MDIRLIRRYRMLGVAPQRHDCRGIFKLCRELELPCHTFILSLIYVNKLAAAMPPFVSALSARQLFALTAVC
jgi:hypothetical protein